MRGGIERCCPFFVMQWKQATRKSTTLNAVQFDPLKFREYRELGIELRKQRTWQVYDSLHDSWIDLNNGDWIMEGVTQENYPVSLKVFDNLYEVRDEDC